MSMSRKLFRFVSSAALASHFPILASTSVFCFGQQLCFDSSSHCSVCHSAASRLRLF